MGETRKLAAIMAVDVVGYSRLMSEDEAGTAKAVREHRRAAVPIVAGLGGRVVKTMGDGLLLEFPSVVAAVECAVTIQNLMDERNVDTPEGAVTRTIARIRLVGKIAHDDLVCPPPVSTRDYPARRLALCAFHPQLSRRRRPARRAWAGCLLRNGAAMGLEVRADVRPGTSSSTPAANLAVASRRECAANARPAMGVRSCIEDEGRPLEADCQG